MAIPTNEEYLALVKQYQESDLKSPERKDALGKIMAGLDGLLHKEANKYYRTVNGDFVEDAYQELFFAVIDCLRKFDPTKTTGKFTSFLFFDVRHYMQKLLCEQSRGAVPVTRGGMQRAKVLAHENESSAAAYLPKIASCSHMLTDWQSEDGFLEFHSHYGLEEPPEAEEDAIKKSRQRLVAGALDILDERTRKIIQLSFYEGKNNVEIADKLGLSRERIRQIINSAKIEMKAYLITKEQEVAARRDEEFYPSQFNARMYM